MIRTTADKLALVKRVRALIAAGHSNHSACGTAGVSNATWLMWEEKLRRTGSLADRRPGRSGRRRSATTQPAALA